MNMKRAALRVLPGALACAIATSAGATLVPRGTEFVYDDALDITWLADANIAATRGYSSTGKMTFDDARSFAQGFAIGGYSDWRLPNMDCFGFDCSNNELAHLYYVTLGVTAGLPITSSINPALAYFFNIQLDPYWLMGTTTMGMAVSGNFDVRDGRTNAGPYLPEFYGWLVRDGDVQVVPEPSSYALALAGLAVLGALSLRSKVAQPGNSR